MPVMPCSNKARAWAGGPGGGGGAAGEGAGAADAIWERVGAFTAAFAAEDFPAGFTGFASAFFFVVVVAMRRGEKYQKLELWSRRLRDLLFSQYCGFLDDLSDISHASSKSHRHQFDSRFTSESRGR
jgi:hypothetical protein